MHGTRGDDRWQPLAIDEQHVDGRVELAVAGEIDMSSVDALRDALTRVTQRHPGAIWLDLSDVGFMDSTGLTALVLAHRTLDDPDRRLTLICPDGPVRRVLELAGLDRIIRVYPDHAEAEAAA